MALTTITEAMKKNVLQNILDDYLALDDSDNLVNHYYVGIGRSEEWNDSDNPTDITDAKWYDFDFRQRLQSIKQISNISFVVPRNNWVSGTVYSGYDDMTSGYPTYKYYVKTDTHDVFICLSSGKNSSTGASVISTVNPSTDWVSNGRTFDPFESADGYVWKYLYTLDTEARNKYLSANYMPVKFLEAPLSETASTQDSDQLVCQNAAIEGQLSQIIVTSGGSGYSSAPTVLIEGDGTGATATANIASGAVISVDVTNMGQDYTRANISFSSGSATARAVVAPQGGFGANPIVDLRGKAMMFNAELDGALGGFIEQDFRQIGILRNVKTPADSDFISSIGYAVQNISYSAISGGTFANDDTITASPSGAQAVIDNVTYDSLTDTGYIYFHQNATTGYGEFTDSDTISNGTATANIDSINDGDINPYSGEVLYIENRTNVDRISTQTEDIKIIIQL